MADVFLKQGGVWFPYPASGSATEPIHVDVKPGRDKGTLTGELNSLCFKYKGGAYKLNANIDSSNHFVNYETLCHVHWLF